MTSVHLQGAGNSTCQQMHRSTVLTFSLFSVVCIIIRIAEKMKCHRCLL